MAAKKTPAKKTPAKKTAAKNTVAVSGGKAQITLDVAEAEKCLRENGKITLGLREVGVTRLRDLTNAIITIN